MRIFLGLICGAALMAPATAAANDRVVVRHDPDTPADERAQLRADVGGHLLGRIGPAGAQTDVIAVPEGTARAAVRELERDSDVRWAEPDVPVRGAEADPLAQWGLGVIGAPTAWTASAGAGVTVGVVDSGASFAHPDLSTQWGANPNEIPGNRKDDDRNGKVDDWRGWDWVGVDDNDPADGHGHGTHVEGIIAAARDNGVGIAGVAPAARLLPLRVLDDTNRGYLSDVASAFRYAGALGLPVVNASLTGTTGLQAVDDAIAASPTTLFVVAAGNRSADVETSPDYPCVIPAPNVLCVAATGADDLLAPYSNRGAVSVDLAAPGTGITSTCRGDTFCVMSGTSMAAPHVAGVAALLAARLPGATPAQLKQALLDSAQRLDALAGTSVTGARLDAAAALGVVEEPPALPSVEEPPAPTTETAPPPPPGDTTTPPADTTTPPADTTTPPDTTTPSDPAPAPTPTDPAPPKHVKVNSRGAKGGSTVAATFTLDEPATVRVTLTPRGCRAARCRRSATVHARAGRTTVRLRRPRGRAYTLSAVTLPERAR